MTVISAILWLFYVLYEFIFDYGKRQNEFNCSLISCKRRKTRGPCRETGAHFLVTEKADILRHLGHHPAWLEAISVIPSDAAEEHHTIKVAQFPHLMHMI